MDWLDNCSVNADLELHNFLEQQIVDGQESRNIYAEQLSAPLWLFGNNVDPISAALVQTSTEPGQYGSVSQPVVQLPTESQGQTAEHPFQEPQDQAVHTSSGSGSTVCPNKQITGSGKRSEAWNAKNRRAQKKFREKQKVHHSTWLHPMTLNVKLSMRKLG